MLIFVIVVLTAWFISTLIAQFWTVPWVARLKSYDLAEVVPGWSFFAPNPGTSDSELLYRDDREFLHWDSDSDSRAESDADDYHPASEQSADELSDAGDYELGALAGEAGGGDCPDLGGLGI